MDARIMAMRMERWREIIVACNTSGMKKKEWMVLMNHQYILGADPARTKRPLPDMEIL